MASLKVYNTEGLEQSSLEASDQVFDAPENMSLVQNAVVALQSAKRQGTHKTKTRADVSGGGAKPFRQKGTGRARQGSSREPHMRGGGVIFGPVPRSYRQKVPTRVRRQALCCALSARVRADRLSVVSGLQVEAPKTKPLAAMISKLAPEGRKTLLVTSAIDQNVILSTRNIPRLTVRTAADVNVLDVLSAQRVVVAEGAVAKLEERLS